MNEQMDKAADGVAEPKPDLDALARVEMPRDLRVTVPPRELEVAMTEEVARILTQDELELFAASNGLARIKLGYVHEMMSRGMIVDKVGLTAMSKGQAMVNGEWIASAIQQFIDYIPKCVNASDLSEVGKSITGLAQSMTKLIDAQTSIQKQQADEKPIERRQGVKAPFRAGEIIQPVNVQVNIDNTKKEQEPK